MNLLIHIIKLCEIMLQRKVSSAYFIKVLSYMYKQLCILNIHLIIIRNIYECRNYIKCLAEDVARKREVTS